MDNTFLTKRLVCFDKKRWHNNNWILKFETKKKNTGLVIWNNIRHKCFMKRQCILFGFNRSFCQRGIIHTVL